MLSWACKNRNVRSTSKEAVEHSKSPRYRGHTIIFGLITANSRTHSDTSLSSAKVAASERVISFFVAGGGCFETGLKVNPGVGNPSSCRSTYSFPSGPFVLRTKKGGNRADQHIFGEAGKHIFLRAVIFASV